MDLGGLQWRGGQPWTREDRGPRGVGLQTLPRTELAGEDHGEETRDCKLTEDKRTYLGQNLSLPRTRPGVGTAGKLYED